MAATAKHIQEIRRRQLIFSLTKICSLAIFQSSRHSFHKITPTGAAQR